MKTSRAVCLPLAVLPTIWAHSIPTANTASGLIIGHVAPNTSDTFEFLGIKYGRAPIDELRSAVPRKYEATAGAVYNASQWNADCPANIPPVSTFPNFTGNGFEVYNKFTAHNNNEQNEDCLALNVWTKSASINASKPVLVFFHGGRFSIPGPHSDFYKGQYLAANENVVVVTINYRLGIFGFSGAPGIEQNVGLRDQRLAVEWVRDNIASFGGDASRITLFGQSAGGASVDYWAYAYRSDPIVAGLISHSGTALSFYPNTASYSTEIFANVSATLGCGTDPSNALSCLRAIKNTTALLSAAARAPILPTKALAQPAFHPTVDDDLVFANYTALGATGHFAPIPYLAGNGNYEAGFYRVSAFSAGVNLSASAWELFNQRAFTCPTKYAADFRAQHGVPVWRYRYMGDWPNLRLYGAWGDYPDSGSYHGSDLGMVFGTAEDISGEVNSEAEERTSRYMQRAWARFAAHPERGLEGLDWLRYGAHNESLVRLAYGNQPEPGFVSPELYDCECPPVDEQDALPGRGAF